MDKTFSKCAQSLLCSGMLSWPEGEEKTTSTEESQGSIPEDLSAGEFYTDVKHIKIIYTRRASTTYLLIQVLSSVEVGMGLPMGMSGVDLMVFQA